MRTRLFVYAIAAFALVHLTCPAAAPSTNVARVSLDSSTTVMGANIADESVLSIGPYASGAMVDLADTLGLSPRVEIDALIVTSNLIIFSLDQDVILGGTYVADEDLAVHEAGTGAAAVYLDGTAIGLPEGADIDAACLEVGETSVLFSVRRTITLPAVGLISDDDVIRWAGGAFSMMANGQTDLGIPQEADVDALHHDGVNLYFSLNISAEIDGETGTDHDIWQYTLQSGDVSIGSSLPVPAGVDVASLDQCIDSDGDGLSDYEEYSGDDEPGTAADSLGTRLDPEGHQSNPFASDTDADGYSDSQEAFLGTDPDDIDDMLEMAEVLRAGGDDIISWESVSGRIYDVEGGSFAPNFEVTTMITGVVASVGTTTSVTNLSPIATDLSYRVKAVGLVP